MVTCIPHLSKRFPCSFDVWEMACTMYQEIGNVVFTGRYAAECINKTPEQTGSIFGSMRASGIICRVGRDRAHRNKFANTYKFSDDFMEYIDRKTMVECSATGG